MTDEQPTNDEILEAVESSGYLLEQRVATILEQLEMEYVVTNWPFTDEDTGKSREMDVVASTMPLNRQDEDGPHRVSLLVDFLIECKNNSSPLLFLTRPKTVADTPPNMRKPMEYKFPKDHFSTFRSGTFENMGLHRDHYYYSHDWKAVQFCAVYKARKGPDKGKWVAKHEDIYDSYFLPLVKALRFKQDHGEHHQVGEQYYTRLYFPIVVVTSKLYTLDTTTAGAEPIEVPLVTYTREIKADRLRGLYAIDFVNVDHLQEFITQHVFGFTDAVKAKIEATPTEFMPEPEHDLRS